MLDTAAGGFLYEDVFSYVKTGFTDLSDGEADLLENYVLKYGIKGKKYFDTWFFGFADNDPKKDFINSARERLVLPFSNFVNGIKRKKTYECKEICSAFLAFLEDLKAEEKILAVSEAFMEAGDRKSADTTKRVYEKVLELIDKTIEILGRETMTLKEFAEIFRAGLAKSDLGIVPPENDMVVVGDLERTRLNGVKVLFVLGANDGVVPKAPEPMGVFSDSEAETFEEIGISAIKGGKRASFEENYLIQIGLLQPSEILRLSYCTMDSEGKELSPSLIINKIKRIFPGIQTADSRKYKDEITLGEPSMHKLSEHLSSGEELSPAWNAVLEYALRDERYRHNVKNMQRAQTDNAYEKNLSPENAERFFGGKRLSLSATGMGLYSGCPFAYFVKYGLKAKEREIYEVNAPHLGTVFHSVLERFSKELAEEKIAWTDLSKEEMESRINRAVDSIAPDYYEKILLSKGGYKYLITRLKRISAKACAALAEHIKRGSFKPLGYEVGFGADEALPPIAVKLSDGREIVMRGKIDRVDIYRRDGDAYVKIIDYKSSGKDIDLLSVYYGIELQLMVYMWALMERGNLILTERLIPGGVFYFGLKKPVENSGVHKELTADEIKSLIFKSFKMNGLVLADEDVVRAMDNDINKSSDIIPVEFNKDGSMAKKSKVLEEADFRAVLEHSMDMFREIGEGISSGRIEPSPYKLKSVNNCTTCGYKSVCRFDPKKKDDKFRILQKKSEDEVLRIIRSEQENRV